MHGLLLVVASLVEHRLWALGASAVTVHGPKQKQVCTQVPQLWCIIAMGSSQIRIELISPALGRQVSATKSPGKPYKCFLKKGRDNPNQINNCLFTVKYEIRPNY